MKILLNQPDCSNYEGFRDMVLFCVLYDTGARVQELTDIKVKDIRVSSPVVITLYGKHRKVRQVPLMGKTSELLTRYLDIKKYHPGIAKANNYIFVNKKNRNYPSGEFYIF
ncbi:tyrosine-type recombinase/integrase [Clostridium frigoriphilum]|uniref:Tyrosine-type recombinase/integrase n=1 Tax=Clostridium frigoriphilum TaxID=443253 RepID=A0ABU7UW05_9CLOT|nr:tyrosine-type recombinase/integrase [Clostridium sp. DSM 17811]